MTGKMKKIMLVMGLTILISSFSVSAVTAEAKELKKGWYCNKYTTELSIKVTNKKFVIKNAKLCKVNKKNYYVNKKVKVTAKGDFKLKFDKTCSIIQDLPPDDTIELSKEEANAILESIPGMLYLFHVNENHKVDKIIIEP